MRTDGYYQCVTALWFHFLVPNVVLQRNKHESQKGHWLVGFNVDSCDLILEGRGQLMLENRTMPTTHTPIDAGHTNLTDG